MSKDMAEAISKLADAIKYHADIAKENTIRLIEAKKPPTTVSIADIARRTLDNKQ